LIQSSCESNLKSNKVNNKAILCNNLIKLMRQN